MPCRSGAPARVSPSRGSARSRSSRWRSASWPDCCWPSGAASARDLLTAGFAGGLLGLLSAAPLVLGLAERRAAAGFVVDVARRLSVFLWAIWRRGARSGLDDLHPSPPGRSAGRPMMARKHRPARSFVLCLIGQAHGQGKRAGRSGDRRRRSPRASSFSRASNRIAANGTSRHRISIRWA